MIAKMNMQDKIIFNTFCKFLAVNGNGRHNFFEARKRAFEELKPMMTWGSFKRKIDSILESHESQRRLLR
jgi:hypothetical protein